MTYKLESGPPGMTVTPQGMLRWPVPATFADKTADVIVSVKDGSGQEIFHTFALSVGDGK